MNTILVCFAITIGVAFAQPTTSLLANPEEQPETGKWGEWKPWGGCSAACGIGSTTRTRECNAIQTQGNDFSQILPFLLPQLTGGSSSMSSILPFLLFGGGNTDMSTMLMMMQLMQSDSSDSSSTSGFSDIWPLLSLTGQQGSSGMSPLMLMLLFGGNNTDTMDPLFLIQLLSSFGTVDESLPICYGPATQKKPCYGIKCVKPTLPPIVPACVSTWEGWGPCSVTCGYGTMVRNRIGCACPGTYGKCKGPGQETKSCGYASCQTSQWEPWSEYSDCQQTMSTAGCYRSRLRKCLGSGCEGPFEQSIECTDCATNSCSVAPSDRRECGQPGITKYQCVQNGCCYDNSIVNTKWCFRKAYL